MVEIYALLEQGRVKYVGAAYDAERRVKKHWRERNYPDRTSACAQWLRTLDDAPDHIVLETVPMDEAAEAECRWIKHFRERGVSLLNQVTGGYCVARIGA